MNPSTLLQLWRDRWHKPLHPDHRVPLEQGNISRWALEIAHAKLWGASGMVWVALLLGVGTLALAGTTHLTVNSQIVFGGSLIGFAVYLRRHHGQVVTLAIACMSVALSLRYFFWRTDATLPPYWSASLALGLALVVAELHGWLRSALGYMTKLWPIELGSAALPGDAVVWPTVQVFVLASDASPAELRNFLHQARKQAWPVNKCQWTIVVADENPALAAMDTEAGVQVLRFSHCPPANAAAQINRALYASDADIVVVTDGKSPLPPDFLSQTVGWFVNEPRLGLVHSPTSFLAPPPSAQVLQYLAVASDGKDWVLARRSALLEIGGLCLDTPTRQHHTCLALQQAAYFTAYGACAPTTDGAPSKWVRIDEPFKLGSLRLRLHMRTLLLALDFYHPVALGIFYLTPFAALCFGAAPIAADFSALSAFWLPHWILGRLVLAPATEHYRLRWLDFVKEELGALAVLLRTTKSFAQAHVRQLAQRCMRQRSTHRNPARTTVPTTHRLELLAGVALITVVSVRTALYWMQHPEIAPTLQWFYLAWAILLALLLVAGLAVQRESDWVRWTQAQLTTLTAMVRVPTGQLYRARTRNFPQLPLELDLPEAAAVTKGQALHISLFLGYQEFVLDCHAVSAEPGGSLRITIPTAMTTEYQNLVAAAFTRPANWPQWLPPVTADHLLPGWLSRLLSRAQDAFYNFAVQSAMSTTIQRMGAWLKPGKTTNG